MLLLSFLLSFYSLHFDRINQVVDFGNSECFSPESSFTIEAWVKNLSDAGYVYTRQIQIINTSYTDTLYDYPVKIEIDSVNFDFSHANSTGNDIYFTTNNGERLYYFIKEWNYSEKRAIIYVRVPEIPTATSIYINMYYGAIIDTTYNIPETVYTIYEDFTHEPMNDTGVGAYEVDTINGYVILTEPIDGQIRYLVYKANPGRHFEATIEFKTYGGTGADAIWFGVYDTSWTPLIHEDICKGGYHFAYDEWDNRIAFTKDTVGGTPIDSYYVSNIDNGEWHTSEVIFNNGSVKIYYDGNLVLTSTDPDPIPMEGSYITLGARTGGENNYHIVRFFSLRKTADPEPTVLIGNESPLSLGITKPGSYSLMRIEGGIRGEVNSGEVIGYFDYIWNHVALVFDPLLDSNNLRLYLNGFLEDETTVDTSLSFNDSSFSIKGFENLEIDELRFWDCALPESLIAQWMNRKVDTLHPLISHLVGFWDFDEGFNDTINDWTGNNPGIAINIDSTNWRISGAPLGEKSVVRKGKFVGVNLNDSLNLILNIYGSTDSTYFWAMVSDTQPFYTGELSSNILQIYPRFWNVKIFNSDNTLLRFYWTGLSVANSDSLRLLRRRDGSDTLWVDLTDVSIINQDEEYIELLGETEGQYIIGTTDTIPTSVSEIQINNGINVVSSIGRLELITSSLHEDRCIEIYDISGRKLLRTYIEGKGRYVLGKNLNSGVYFFKILPWHIKGRFIVF